MGQRWAVIIGIDEYADPAARLRGAVRDANAMYAWVTAPADRGGGVPPENVLLMLGRNAASDPPPAGAMPITDVTKDSIVRNVKQLVATASKQEDRLYFYFSGHGFSTRAGATLDAAIAAGDFSSTFPDHSISLASLFEYFQGSPFLDQYFFIDACRNLPFSADQQVDTGKISPRPVPDASRPAVQQFRLYATSPGVKAKEVDERGAFSAELFRGLAGAGKAKAWLGGEEKYIVRVSRLFEFVRVAVTTRKLADDKPDFIQVPTRDGQAGAIDRESDPVVVQFDADAFPDARIDVLLDPADKAADATVSVLRDGNVVAQKTAAEQPVSFLVPPREYSVRTEVPGKSALPAKKPIDAYDAPDRPQQLTVQILDVPALPVHFGVGATRLTVQGADALEIADSTGKVVRNGSGQLDVKGLPPGFYRVRAVREDSDVEEELIELEPGATETVRFSPAPKLPKMV
jgi:hypothetical protein